MKYDIDLTEVKDFTSIFITSESGGSLLHPRAQVSLGLHYSKATPTPSGGNPNIKLTTTMHNLIKGLPGMSFSGLLLWPA